MKRATRWLAATAIAVGFAFVPGVASAQYPPPCLVLGVTQTVTVMGNGVTVTACGIRQSSAMRVSLEGTDVQFEVPVVDQEVAFTVPVPADVAPGVYILAASALEAAEGRPIEFRVPITVVDPASPEAKALTETAAAPVWVPPASDAPVDGSSTPQQARVLGTQIAAAAPIETGPTPAGLQYTIFGLFGFVSVAGLMVVAWYTVLRPRMRG